MPWTRTVDDPAVLAKIAVRILAVDRQLRGAAGVAALVTDPPLLNEVVHLALAMGERVVAIDEQLDTLELDARLIDEARGIEAVNASLVGLKDAVWAIEHDRVRTASAVRELAPPESSAAAITAYLSIQQALSALDRLEVRGRDSAGLYVLVRNHGLDLGSGSLAAELARRRGDPLFASGGVELAEGHLGFVYKAAAEIGELGDNTRALRSAPSPPTSCCVERCRRRRPRRSCSATPVGPASASSRRPTPIH